MQHKLGFVFILLFLLLTNSTHASVHQRWSLASLLNKHQKLQWVPKDFLEKVFPSLDTAVFQLSEPKPNWSRGVSEIVYETVPTHTPSMKYRKKTAYGAKDILEVDGVEYHVSKDELRPARIEKKKEYRVLTKDGCYYGCLSPKGRKHGQGTMTYADGTRYSGEWRSGKKRGYGALTSPVFIPNTYKKVKGTWNDRGVVKARVEYHNHPDVGPWQYVEYTGSLNHELKPHGQGCMKTYGGCVYQGSWKDGRPHGQGTLFFPGGFAYQWDAKGQGQLLFDGTMANPLPKKQHKAPDTHQLEEMRFPDKQLLSPDVHKRPLSPLHETLLSVDPLDNNTEIGWFQLKSGDRYYGGMKEGLPHGVGLWTKHDGRFGIGEWSEGTYLFRIVDGFDVILDPKRLLKQPVQYPRS